MDTPYLPTWNSLRAHTTPKWFQDAKFGIYTHWGVYSVPACGPNVSWYPHNMYRQGTPQHEYHIKNYGPQFGYKDFIPMFTGEKFDPDEWADLFQRSGAQFAGPVGEHHDGFCMWNTRFTEWNAAKMGPHRDVVGQLEKAIRSQGMRFLVALHHAENWWFYPHWKKEYDTSDPRYVGLYGEQHNMDGNANEEFSHDDFSQQARPSQKFLETWEAKIQELIDGYLPDVLWFDFGLKAIPEQYKQDFLAYYYNKAVQLGKEVAVIYKWHDLPPGIGVVDLELGRFDTLTYHDWITDTTVDDGSGWGYMKNAGYKSLRTLVHYLIDNVSKNGSLLLNVGPKPNGEIPEQAKELLIGMGKWLEVNGEAIFGTTPWMNYGSGPTRMEKSGYFMEDQEVQYTAKDIRFTTKNDALFAICLGWPQEDVLIEELRTLYPAEIYSVRMLGVDHDLKWSLNEEGLRIIPPVEKPSEHAFVFKIIRGSPYQG